MTVTRPGAPMESTGPAPLPRGRRTGLDNVKSVMQALIQAERYGTSVGTSLRVMAEEGRETRMMDAEKKAAALPAKLTVPMILFFLPVLFLVVLGPAYIKYNQMQKDNEAAPQVTWLTPPSDLA